MFLKFSIYKITSVKTGEVFEGTSNECSEKVGRSPSRFSQGCRNDCLIAGEWLCEKITDEDRLRHHKHRLGVETTCIICGESFVPATLNQKCCSQECSRELDRRRDRERRRAERTLDGLQDKKHSVPCVPGDLGDFAVEAMEAGTSYGKLEAQRWMEKNHIVRRKGK